MEKRLACSMFAALQQSLISFELLDDKGLLKPKKKNLALYESYLMDFYHYLGKNTAVVTKEVFDNYVDEYNKYIRELHESHKANNLVVVISLIEADFSERSDHAETIKFAHKFKELYRLFHSELDTEVIKTSKWAGINMYKLLTSGKQESVEKRLARIALWK